MSANCSAIGIDSDWSAVTGCTGCVEFLTEIDYAGLGGEGNACGIACGSVDFVATNELSDIYYERIWSDIVVDVYRLNQACGCSLDIERSFGGSAWIVKVDIGNTGNCR